MTVSILGVDYSIEFSTGKEDSHLETYAGYVDTTTKTIIVREMNDRIDLENKRYFQKEIIRHEIIHAFFYESGLDNNVEHTSLGVEETIVDWIAIQFPKMLKAFQEADAL